MTYMVTHTDNINYKKNMHQIWPTSNAIIMDDRSEKAKKGEKRHQLTGGPSTPNLSHENLK